MTNPFYQLCYRALADDPAPLVKHLRAAGVTLPDAKRFLVNLRELASPADTLDAIAAAISTCPSACQHLDRTGYARGTGPTNPPLMLIGESPGRNEAREHLPFIGPAGQLLTRLLARIGLCREQVYLTNTVRCFTTNKDRLTPEIAATCRRYLLEEIRVTNPRAVICLGRFAWENFMQETHSGRLDDLRQQWRPVRLPVNVRQAPLHVAFSYHPAAGLHQPQYVFDMEEDFDWIGETMQLGGQT